MTKPNLLFFVKTDPEIETPDDKVSALIGVAQDQKQAEMHFAPMVYRGMDKRLPAVVLSIGTARDEFKIGDIVLKTLGD